MTVWAIVVAAGTGTRFGGPKQFAWLSGRRVVERALSGARAVADGVVVVVPETSTEAVQPADHTVVGGATRSASVRAGLAATPAEADIVVVHDGCRPLASPKLFESVVDAVRAGADAAVPGLPPTDTVKRVEGERVVTTIERGDLVAVQTPQAFRASALREAHATAPEASDDAALVEVRGGTVRVVRGDALNLKLTRREDLVMAEALLSGGRGGQRVGMGFDVHPFSSDPSRPLVLGGVAFADEAGLAGHSDADVIAHAVADALLGAAGLGDLGEHFPDDDPAWRDADSVGLLGRVAERVVRAGWQPANVDCAVVLETPRLALHRPVMERRLGAAVGAPVTVKASRPEGIGALGRREGIACWAVAQLEAIVPGGDAERSVAPGAPSP